MATHDRNMLKRADIERFQVWLNENSLAWRPGKGEFQLMQVKLKTGWPAICVNTQGVVTTPPAIREMIQRFRKGLPYTGNTPRKPEEDSEFLGDLRDDFAMAAMQGMIAAPIGKFTHSEFNGLAESAYAMADAMLAARDK